MAGLFAVSACVNPALSPQSASSASAIAHQQWQPVTLDFEGPEAGEDGALNPFTDMRLEVVFTHDERDVAVRGFFAADGNAAETGADAGAIWRARFMPDEVGEWRYSARLVQADDAAISSAAPASAETLGEWQGRFIVAPPADDATGFYADGKIVQDGRYFRVSGAGRPWLKGGANSPENLLAFVDFDGTYRVADNARDGESDAGGMIHGFAPHARDWRAGDPVWQGTKGKGLIGAINYLADQGMNAAYFLTLNVDGDGKDVWPWINPNDPTRFDVSKLAQWEIVFRHMQARGIALHIVVQETENELLLDGGDTGRLRGLYFNELIARFAHHPGLFWNLGEENGPVHWRPEGQTDAQRMAMADYFAANDPYQHPVLLHTHAEAADKDAILTPLLGHPTLDGLSFQVAERETVNAEVRKWMNQSESAGQSWAITMDEIGKWPVGARADEDDPAHDSLRRHALWGTLLAGGAGVEWYFGAHQKGNDLTTEDWRSRANLWSQTRIALGFFDSELEYTAMQPCEGPAYCLADPGRTYAIYWSAETPQIAAGAVVAGRYIARSFDPVSGNWDDAAQQIELSPNSDLKQVFGQPSETDRVLLLSRVGAQ